MIQLQIFEGISTLDQEAIMDKYFTKKTYISNEAIVKKGTGTRCSFSLKGWQK